MEVDDVWREALVDFGWSLNFWSARSFQASLLPHYAEFLRWGSYIKHDVCRVSIIPAFQITRKTNTNTNEGTEQEEIFSDFFNFLIWS